MFFTSLISRLFKPKQVKPPAYRYFQFKGDELMRNVRIIAIPRDGLTKGHSYWSNDNNNDNDKGYSWRLNELIIGGELIDCARELSREEALKIIPNLP